MFGMSPLMLGGIAALAYFLFLRPSGTPAKTAPPEGDGPLGPFDPSKLPPDVKKAGQAVIDELQAKAQDYWTGKTTSTSGPMPGSPGTVAPENLYAYPGVGVVVIARGQAIPASHDLLYRADGSLFAGRTGAYALQR